MCVYVVTYNGMSVYVVNYNGMFVYVVNYNGQKYKNKTSSVSLVYSSWEEKNIQLSVIVVNLLLNYKIKIALPTIKL